MKCAKCGHEVDPSSPNCPYCAAGAAPKDDNNAPRACCPRCGSTDIEVVRKVYDPGCGCLGFLLWGWIGLLLGLLGNNDVEIVCLHCGCRWRPGTRGGSGCLLTLLTLIGFSALLTLAGWIVIGASLRGY